jgi:hypothetical protein
VTLPSRRGATQVREFTTFAIASRSAAPASAGARARRTGQQVFAGIGREREKFRAAIEANMKTDRNYQREA